MKHKICSGRWIQNYPCKTNSAQPRRKAKIHFIRAVFRFSIRVCEELNWNHERDLRRTDPKHGIAERAVRRVKEGTSSVSVQSGLEESWWADAMEFFIAISETCKTYWQMARRLTHVGSIHHWKGRSFVLQQKFYSNQCRQKTKVESVCSARKSFLEYSRDTS